MKKNLLLLISLTSVWGCSPKKPGSDAGKSSYFIGQQIGLNLKRQGIDLDQKLVMQGLSDSLNGNKSLLDEEEMRLAQQLFNRMVNEKIKETEKARLKTANEFLEMNRKNPGWGTTKSGLQYKVLKAGKGKRPGPKSLVEVHYVGSLHDGTKFDSSRDRGKPMEFKVDGVINGWTEALQLMPEGSHWVIVLPPHLAYGATGSGPIPPNSVLIFDLELVKIR